MEIEKRYWTIGEMARKYGIAISKIRFWMKSFGLDHKLKRDTSDARLFTKEDIADLEEIYYLVEVRKFRIEGARYEFKERRKTREGTMLGKGLSEETRERPEPV